MIVLFMRNLSDQSNTDINRKMWRPSILTIVVRFFQAMLFIIPAYMASLRVTSSQQTLVTSVGKDRSSPRNNYFFPFNPKKSIPQTKQRTTRFPKYGTVEFFQRCNWTLPAPETPDPTCAYLARPPVNSNEGISDWISGIVTSYLMARQIGCKVYIDYGEDVDIHKVVTIFSNSHQLHNWTTPANFDCNGCDKLLRSFHGGHRVSADAPKYRYSMTAYPFTRKIYTDDFAIVKQKLPGFDLETGVACSLGPLFNLAPSAVAFEPDLFVKLLPALQDDKALVIAVYARTHWSDAMAKMEEKNGTIIDEKWIKISNKFQSLVDQTLCVEKKYLSGKMKDSDDLGDFTHIVWMIVTDSQEAKQFFVDNYDGEDANERILEDARKWKAKSIPRKIINTNTRGIHTRAKRHPSTSEFAEAFIDWYLLGESDVVVSESHSSFGAMGAMRTFRPLYLEEEGKNHECDPVPVLYKRNQTDATNKTRYRAIRFR